MKNEQKELLLKDLCARLPYRTLISIGGDGNKYRMEEIRNALIGIDTFKITIDDYDIEHIKPYLFPMSGMTEEQLSYIHFNTKFNIDRFGTITPKIDEDNFPVYVDMEDWISLYCWLNKNHLDYRGLIEKGLALDATGLNIY